MRTVISSLLLLMTVLGAAEPARSQDGGPPMITLMLRSRAELVRDIKVMMELGGEKVEKQFPLIEQVLIPAFLDPVEQEGPIRIDIIPSDNPKLRFCFPVADEEAGKTMATILGWAGGKKMRKLKKGYYRLQRPEDRSRTGYLKILNNPRYAIIWEDKELAIRLGFPTLTSDLDPLLKAGYDVGAIIRNSAKDKDVDSRRKAITDLKKEILAALKPLKDETDEQFEIRREALTQQLVELERIYAESEELILGWTTDQTVPEGRLELNLSALAGSDLEASIKLLAVKPRRFHLFRPRESRDRSDAAEAPAEDARSDTARDHPAAWKGIICHRRESGIVHRCCQHGVQDPGRRWKDGGLRWIREC